MHTTVPGWARAAGARLRAIDAVPPVDRTALRRHTAPATTLLRVATVVQIGSSVLTVVTLAGIWIVARAAYDAHLDASADPRSAILTGIAVVAAAVVAGFLATSAAYYLTHLADLEVRRHVRLLAAEHIARLPLGWFTSEAAEKSLSVFGNDVETLHGAVAHGRMELIQASVAPIAVWVWLVAIDWRIAVALMIPVLTYYFLQQGIYKRAQAYHSEQGPAIAELLAASHEELRDAVTLRLGALGATSSRLSRAHARLHHVIVESHREQESRGTRIGALVDPVSTLLVVFGSGWLLVRADALAPADLVPFVVAAPLLAAAPAAITLARWGVVGAANAATGIDRFLAEPPLPVPERPMTPADNAISLSGVGFAYDGATPVIDDVSLEIPEGSFVAVVGPSGSGKSTLAALVARHHDVTSGVVRLGGVDVRDIDPVELARRVTVLPQRAILLRTTVADNIRLARPDAELDEVIAAARIARIDTRIRALPDGYDTIVGEDIALSSGERQRIALARAVVTDPAVLVLDEPTSNIDPESAAAIHEALTIVGRDRTMIHIAHDLRTITAADRIVVVEAGRLTQLGDHAALAGRPGTYRTLWEATMRNARTTASRGVPR